MVRKTVEASKDGQRVSCYVFVWLRVIEYNSDLWWFLQLVTSFYPGSILSGGERTRKLQGTTKPETLPAPLELSALTNQGYDAGGPPIAMR